MPPLIRRVAFFRRHVSPAPPHPQGPIDVRRLDLADLASVKAFADGLAGEAASVDLLINNAGVMACDHRATADGFEAQMGTNHLGHFALTNRLLPLLEASKVRVGVCVCVGGRGCKTFNMV